MSKVIETLRQDHRNLSQLLDLIDRQLAIFDRGERPDYEILESAIEYCLNYPDLKHHPLEDLVFRRLQDKGIELEPPADRLLLEHESLGALTRRVAGAVNNILQEAEMPRDAFVKTMRDFLTFYRDHIRKEERHFFPAALRELGEQDWTEIDEAAQVLEDPLFGEESDERFRRLRESVLAWSQESQ